MEDDFIWISIIVINIGGFFIQVERPIWAFYLQKWTTINIEIRSGPKLSANWMSLFVVFIFYNFFNSDNQFLNYAFTTVVLFYTFLSIFKLINAIPVMPQSKRVIFKVIDSFSFHIAGRGGSQKFLVVKAENPELGIRILPALPYSFETALRPNSSISILYRRGLLGGMYRFSFDYL